MIYHFLKKVRAFSCGNNPYDITFKCLNCKYSKHKCHSIKRYLTIELL